jgi:HlyD family secretion protein
VVRAPFAGTVISTAVEVGETTAPGGVICQLADTSALHVDAELDEADVGRVSVGMPVDVTLDAFPGERIRGKLTEVAPSVARDARGGRSVNVDVALPADPRLRVGMSADVDVIVSTRENTLFVSPNAVVGRGTDRSVYLVTDGVAHLRKVDVGVSTWEAVEIKGGLSEKDQVVSSLSSSKMQDNVRATINAAPTPIVK